MNNIITFLSGNIWATFEAIITIFTLIFVCINFIKNRKRNDAISIYIFQDNQKKEIQNSIIRQHITRAEIKGVLNDCGKEKTYDIAYLSSNDFFEQMQRLHRSEINEFVINITSQDTYQLKTKNDNS